MTNAIDAHETELERDARVARQLIEDFVAWARVYGFDSAGGSLNRARSSEDRKVVRLAALVDCARDSLGVQPQC